MMTDGTDKKMLDDHIHLSVYAGHEDFRNIIIGVNFAEQLL